MSKCISAKLPEYNDDEFFDLMKGLNEIGRPFKLTSVWSIYEAADRMYETAIKGTFTLVYAIHWGDQTHATTVKDPTWLDLWVAADHLIKQSGDRHHIFIEEFVKKGNTLELTTGS